MTGWQLERAEDAWANYLSGSFTSASVNVYRGNEELDKAGPAVICFATDSDEVEVGSGIYRVTMVLHLAYPFDSGSLVTRNEVVGEFAQKVYNNPNIINALTGSTTNLDIYALYFQAHNNGFEGDCWVSNNLLDMIVAVK